MKEIVNEFAAKNNLMVEAIWKDIFYNGSYTKRIFPNLYIIRYRDLNESNLLVGTNYEKVTNLLGGYHSHEPFDQDKFRDY